MFFSNVCNGQCTFCFSNYIVVSFCVVVESVAEYIVSFTWQSDRSDYIIGSPFAFRKAISRYSHSIIC